MKTRTARTGDFPAICELIEKYAGQGLLLPRAAADVRAQLDRFLVVTEAANNLGSRAERLLGCVSLEPYGNDLAEVRSLAVIPEARGRGAGGELIEAALETARGRGIARIFAVTHAPGLFERHGFDVAPRQAVPEKIERDCHTCSHKRDCELVAVVAVVCADRDLLHVLSSPFKVGAAL